MSGEKKAQFVCYYYFQSWRSLNLGLHVSLARPELEVHLPFGFIRVGWTNGRSSVIHPRSFGYKPL